MAESSLVRALMTGSKTRAHIVPLNGQPWATPGAAIRRGWRVKQVKHVSVDAPPLENAPHPAVAEAGESGRDVHADKDGL
eukprot:6349499-Pyramimonas_sp.AAC.1